MKKIIIAAAVTVTFCLQLNAQTSAVVSASITEGFNEEFKGASDVIWEKISKDIFLVRFNREQENSIAYFDNAGKLLTSGRKIAFNKAPRLVKNGIENIMKSYEKKNGALLVTHVYELIENGQVKYYINMGNDNLYLALVSNSNGSTSIIKNVKLDYAKQSAPMIASFK